MMKRITPQRILLLGLAAALFMTVASRGGNAHAAPADVAAPARRVDQRGHWSFQPLPASEPLAAPIANLKSPMANPLDGFIDAKLAEKGLRRSPPADPVALIRRLSFDLTGLPPTPERVAAFVAECRTGSAFVIRDSSLAALVDELLASPRHGERWAQHWLDVVRYADTHGFEVNTERPNAWPYRDYVIRAFNHDTPYDRFIKEQIVGDALGEDAATGFLVTASVLLPGQIGKDAESIRLARQDALDEMVNNIGQTFLGLSVGCARCHDHKFDPITAKDYYAMQAFVAGVEYGDREVRTPEAEARRKEIAPARQRVAELDKQLAPPGAKARVTDAQENGETFAVLKEKRALEAKIKAAENGLRAFAGIFRKPDEIHLLHRGDPEQPQEAVAPAVLSALGGQSLAFDSPEPERRAALAEWVASAQNPLPARVMVNRIWQGHFGVGLVETPSDFGRMGARPTHPELLDWLAGEFVRGGWSVKRLHKLIVMSATYRQSAPLRDRADRTDRAGQSDPSLLDSEARLLWRFPSQRLGAETIRDAMLAVSGRLNPTMYGRGYDLFDKRGGLSGFKPVESYSGDGLRRMIYAHKVRREREAVFGSFDCPDAGQSTARRRESTTPIQALNLFNSRFTLEESEAFAARVKQETGEDSARQIRRAYELALGRAATAEELREAEAAVRGHGLATLCRALFNSNEFLFVP